MIKGLDLAEPSHMDSKIPGVDVFVVLYCLDREMESSYRCVELISVICAPLGAWIVIIIVVAVCGIHS